MFNPPALDSDYLDPCSGARISLKRNMTKGGRLLAFLRGEKLPLARTADKIKRHRKRKESRS